MRSAEWKVELSPSLLKQSPSPFIPAAAARWPSSVSQAATQQCVPTRFHLYSSHLSILVIDLSLHSAVLCRCSPWAVLRLCDLGKEGEALLVVVWGDVFLLASRLKINFLMIPFTLSSWDSVLPKVFVFLEDRVSYH